ncbi:MAG: hypothetical protein ACK5CA_00835 [Cyanobacteriota bacterium]|jgi:hypothetical protein
MLNSALPSVPRAQSWPLLLLGALGFWLSASLAMDLIMMPGLFAAGMMTQPDFVAAGYLLFGLFNRLELLLAALCLSGFLVLGRRGSLTHHPAPWPQILAGALLVIALVQTYALTPLLTGWAFSLSQIGADPGLPGALVVLHGLYWSLELGKWIIGAALLRWCFQDSYRAV